LARSRESLLAKYVFFNHPLFEKSREKIIEVEEDEDHFLLPETEQYTRVDTLEGGDVMMVAPNHLLIGISERTSVEAAKQVIAKLFERNVLEKVTLIKIPAKRDYMHIDTVFTQIKRNVWVVLGSIARSAERAQRDSLWEELGQSKVAEQLVIHQFLKNKTNRRFENLEDLLISISRDDLKCKEEVKFIYSGNNEFPYGAREQWTDSCNLLVIKEGVAIGYDRNDRTSKAFENAGFQCFEANDLLALFDEGKLDPETIENTIILLPSAELSRARGGSHCMSMPIQRVKFF
jgi:arginine deiminase